MWGKDNGGAIPPNFLFDDAEDALFNILVESNTSSNDQYRKSLRVNKLPAHPAPFPRSLPKFFIEFLTNEGDIVLDPFAGSNLTGFEAEKLNRSWIVIDSSKEYLRNSIHRWESLNKED